MRGAVPAVAALLLLLAAPAPARAEEPSPAGLPAEIPLREGLLLSGPAGTSARSPIHTDAVEAHIVRGTWTPPAAGGEVVLPDGSKRTWGAAKAGADGAFTGEAMKPGTYLSFRVASEAERVMVLHAVGHDFVYVNGELRAGDPYGYGWLRLPVALRKGENELLFRASRGRLSATLRIPPAPVFLAPEDATLPDLAPAPAGRSRPPDASAPTPVLDAAVVVVNATSAPATGLLVRVRPDGGGEAISEGLPAVPALSVRKVRVPVPAAPPPGVEKGWRLGLELVDASGGAERALHRASIGLEVRDLGLARRVTFVSGIDGSVQFYARLEARPGPGSERPGLLLSLHGASVDARAQADAYARKPALTIACPTNRRPFGFDWEDWGRLDAMEVLERAAAAPGLPPCDPARTYLTGHSMGGHGTWILGATFPDRFAAIGPSAGWVSFVSYGGAPAAEPKDDVERMLRRAATPSDTLALSSNLAAHGVYVLHGDADDNVPVGEARTMAERLATFHRDFVVHEQKGAGHWWDASDEPGVDCVDWAPMTDFFGRHAVPPAAGVREVDFATASPGISSDCRWVRVLAQTRPLALSRVRLRCDPGARRYAGTTENVRAMLLSLAPFSDERRPLRVELDGTVLAEVHAIDGRTTVASRGQRALALVLLPDGRWEANVAALMGIARRVAHEGEPSSYGPFKDAFRQRFALVYGTAGTPEENAWALAKARCDAETWYYRGNGAVDVASDEEWREAQVDPARAAADARRNLILYGNADTNTAWSALLPAGEQEPVEVRRGRARVGARTLSGDDLAVVAFRPRSRQGTLVGIVAGTGVPGMRLCDRLPYFTSGVHFPDVTVFRVDALEKGPEGVRCAGFFGPDWGVETGEFAWRD